jgi:hypothetical protein
MNNTRHGTAVPKLPSSLRMALSPLLKTLPYISQRSVVPLDVFSRPLFSKVYTHHLPPINFVLLSKIATAPAYVFFLPSEVLHIHPMVSPACSLSQKIIQNDRKMHHVLRLPKRLLYGMARHVPYETPQKVHPTCPMSVFSLLKTLLYVYKGQHNLPMCGSALLKTLQFEIFIFFQNLIRASNGSLHVSSLSRPKRV